MGVPDKREAVLPVTATTEPKNTSAKWKFLRGGLAAILVLSLLPRILPERSEAFISATTIETVKKSAECKQAESIYPSSFDVSALVQGQKDRIVDWLAGAVRVPTEIFDVMGPVDEDKRWDAFYKFAECECEWWGCGYWWIAAVVTISAEWRSIVGDMQINLVIALIVSRTRDTGTASALR